MSGDAFEMIRRRDEILQVMYWMRGEGLGGEVGVTDLRLFLNDVDEATLTADLAGLTAAGLLAPAGAGRYRLSARGQEEGGRRFADEFAELLGQGHGACSDPNCDCHTFGPEACGHLHT
jgi:hypothetical protein